MGNGSTTATTHLLTWSYCASPASAGSKTIFLGRVLAYNIQRTVPGLQLSVSWALNRSLGATSSRLRNVYRVWLILIGLFTTAGATGEATNPGPAPCDFDDPEGLHNYDLIEDMDALFPPPFEDVPSPAYEYGDCDGPAHDDQRTAREGRRDEMEVGDVPAFTSASKFLGTRRGMVFRVGQRGLGYYRDSVVDDSASPETGRPAPVTLVLDDLLPDEAGSAACPTPQPAASGEYEHEESGGKRQRMCTDGRWTSQTRTRTRARARRRHRDAQAVAPPRACGKAYRHEGGNGVWMIDSVNPNCWAATVGDLGVTSADVVASQEAKRLDHQTKSAENEAPRIGWKAVVAAAQRTWTGRASGGTAVASRRHIGMAMPHGVTVAEEFAPRISMAWVGGMVPGGFVMFSVYLYPAEGVTPRNQAVLDEVARLAALLRCPWIVAADWQMCPEDVASARWPALVGATQVAPGAVTCNNNTIDYFAVHDSLMPLVCGVAVVDDAGFHPHSPVRLFIRAGEKMPPVRRMAPPKGFPAEVPHGCLPSAATLPLQRTDGHGPLSDMPNPSSHSVDCDPHLEADFELWLDTAEEELADMLGLDGKERRAHTGRKNGPRFIVGSATKGTGDAHVVKATALARAWRCVAQWSAAMATAVRAHDAPAVTKTALEATARRAACKLHAMAGRTVPFSSWTTDAQRGDLPEELVTQRTVAPQMMAIAALAAAQRPADLDEIVSTARTAAERHERGYVSNKLLEWKRWLRGGARRRPRQAAPLPEAHGRVAAFVSRHPPARP